jgi:hypothetical protein
LTAEYVTPYSFSAKLSNPSNESNWNGAVNGTWYKAVQALSPPVVPPARKYNSISQHILQCPLHCGLLLLLRQTTNTAGNTAAAAAKSVPVYGQPYESVMSSQGWVSLQVAAGFVTELQILPLHNCTPRTLLLLLLLLLPERTTAAAAAAAAGVSFQVNQKLPLVSWVLPLLQCLCQCLPICFVS